MKKPEGLGRLLLAAVPSLGGDPTRLQLFVDAGRIVARRGAKLNYEYRYTLTIVVQDFAGDVDTLFVPILAWIAEQQPDLLDRPDHTPFAFKTEILDSQASDVEIAIELTEHVLVAPGDAGGWGTTRVDERRIGLDEFPGVCGVDLWRLFLRDDLVARTANPADA